MPKKKKETKIQIKIQKKKNHFEIIEKDVEFYDSDSDAQEVLIPNQEED